MSTRRAPYRATALAVMLVLALVMAAPALGAANNGFEATIGCDGFTPNGGSFTANRDNTGTGLESIAYNAVDGNGIVVFQLVDAVPVGWTVTPAAVTTGWSTTPTANPINMSIVSIGGSGIAQETIYSVSGTCDGLPTGTSNDATSIVSSTQATVINPSTIAVSPSVQPGDDIPVPTTNTSVIEALPYYAIVDTPRLNLRSGDGPQFLPVAVVQGGTRVQLVGRNNGSSWWLVEAGGFVGWASAEFLAVRGNATVVPFVQAAGDVIPVTLVTAINQRVYAEPNDFNTSFVCEIPPGEWRLLGKDRFDVFYKVRATCVNGVTVEAWLRGEEGLFRNPAALSLSVLSE
ncbi:MAG: SH3 domain-containing protein [Chloroflexota bacterium]